MTLLLAGPSHAGGPPAYSTYAAGQNVSKAWRSLLWRHGAVRKLYRQQKSARHTGGAVLAGAGYLGLTTVSASYAVMGASGAATNARITADAVARGDTPTAVAGAVMTIVPATFAAANMGFGHLLARSVRDSVNSARQRRDLARAGTIKVILGDAGLQRRLNNGQPLSQPTRQALNDMANTLRSRAAIAR